MDKLDIMSVVNYTFDENFFKEIIGTGNELKEWLAEDYIEKKGYFYQKTNKLTDKLIYITDSEKENYHNNLINNYYKPILEETNITDFMSYKKNVRNYVNITYHLIEIKNYELAINYLYLIYKKMIYWGNIDILEDKLKKVRTKELDFVSRMRYSLMFMFMYICVTVNANIVKKDFNKIEKQFKYIEKHKNNDIHIYLEARNVLNILTTKINNNMEESISDYNNILDKYAIELDDNLIIKSRIYENLSICYGNIDNDKSSNYLDEAKKCIEESEKYEYLKLIYFITNNYYLSHKENEFIKSYINFYNKLDEDSYPDIERNICNLFAKFNLEKLESPKDYIYYLTIALKCDLVLYIEYFKIDLLNMLKTILNNKQNIRENIDNGEFDPLYNLLDVVNFKNEKVFIQLVEKVIKNETIESKEINKIKSKSLTKIFEEFRERME